MKLRQLQLMCCLSWPWSGVGLFCIAILHKMHADVRHELRTDLLMSPCA